MLKEKFEKEKTYLNSSVHLFSKFNNYLNSIINVKLEKIKWRQ